MNGDWKPTKDSTRVIKIPEVKKITGGLTEFNWKYANISPISSVKDQENFGSSYAFAVVCAVEAAMAFETGKQTDLSVQQVMDCSSGTNTPTETNLYCDGGNLQSTWNYVSNMNNPIFTAEISPYKGEMNMCADETRVGS